MLAISETHNMYCIKLNEDRRTLQNIVNSGVRLAVSTLCEGVENSYPSFDWDIGVLSLVDDNGNAILPQWKNYKLGKHPNCPYCANK